MGWSGGGRADDLKPLDMNTSLVLLDDQAAVDGIRRSGDKNL